MNYCLWKIILNKISFITCMLVLTKNQTRQKALNNSVCVGVLYTIRRYFISSEKINFINSRYFCSWQSRQSSHRIPIINVDTSINSFCLCLSVSRSLISLNPLLFGACSDSTYAWRINFDGNYVNENSVGVKSVEQQRC